MPDRSIADRALLIAFVVLAACAGTVGPRPGDPCEVRRAFAPWDATRPPGRARDASAPTGAGLADALVATYQRALRRPELPGQGCPFEPTCSHFAREAIARHGMLGLLLTFDRLIIREHPLAGSRYLTTCVAGTWRWHDPVP